MSEAPDQVKTIFGHALELESPDERIRYLNQACGDDSALRADVDQLLAAIDRAGSFLVARTPDAAPTLAPPFTNNLARRSGPTNCCKCSAKVAWARYLWPNRRSRSNAA